MKTGETLKTTPNGEFQDDKKIKEQQDNALSACINLAVQMESNFKLFSYRIIDKDVYIHRTNELIEITLKHQANINSKKSK